MQMMNVFVAQATFTYNVSWYPGPISIAVLMLMIIIIILLKASLVAGHCASLL